MAKVKNKSNSELRLIISDCNNALRCRSFRADPEDPKAVYYQDEIHYCAAELARRETLKLCTEIIDRLS